MFYGTIKPPVNMPCAFFMFDMNSVMKTSGRNNGDLYCAAAAGAGGGVFLWKLGCFFVRFRRAADVLPAQQLGGEFNSTKLWNFSGSSTVRKQGIDISLSLSFLGVLIAVVRFFASCAWLLVRAPCSRV